LASGSGTVATQVLYAAYNGSESVVAVEQPSGTTSNTLTIAEPWLQ
jgi:diaminopimelate epimerase